MTHSIPDASTYPSRTGSGAKPSRLTSLYDQVTSKIVAELEAGAIPWTKPWKHRATGSLMPQNFATGRPYSGINIPILWAAAIEGGFSRHQWVTFKQALALGGKVRKGEHGTMVVFTKKLRVGEDEDERLISILRTYFVFNVDQLDGVPERDLELPPEPARMDKAEDFIAATKADIRIGGGQAAYIPSLDCITIPPLAAFRDAGSFYATLLHEGAHWTAAKNRLNRDLSNRFRTRAYAAEELIAELTAAFLCAHLGIEGELRHAGYIEDWIALLSDDSRAIFTAASKASQAADFLRRFSEGDVE
jgi:antirestriction protein ArdC